VRVRNSLFSVNDHRAPNQRELLSWREGKFGREVLLNGSSAGLLFVLTGSTIARYDGVWFTVASAQAKNGEGSHV